MNSKLVCKLALDLKPFPQSFWQPVDQKQLKIYVCTVVMETFVNYIDSTEIALTLTLKETLRRVACLESGDLKNSIRSLSDEVLGWYPPELFAGMSFLDLTHFDLKVNNKVVGAERIGKEFKRLGTMSAYTIRNSAWEFKNALDISEQLSGTQKQLFGALFVALESVSLIYRAKLKLSKNQKEWLVRYTSTIVVEFFLLTYALNDSSS